MQVLLGRCVVSDLFEGESDNGPWMRLSFLDLGDTFHEYTSYVPDALMGTFRTVPRDGTIVAFTFDVGKNQRDAPVLRLAGWEVAS